MSDVDHGISPQQLRDRVFYIECEHNVLLKRLDAALQRIEALELEVARMRAPMPSLADDNFYAKFVDHQRAVNPTQSSVPPTKLSCGCVVQCHGHAFTP